MDLNLRYVLERLCYGDRWAAVKYFSNRHLAIRCAQRKLFSFDWRLQDRQTGRVVDYEASDTPIALRPVHEDIDRAVEYWRDWLDYRNSPQRVMFRQNGPDFTEINWTQEGF